MKTTLKLLICYIFLLPVALATDYSYINVGDYILFDQNNGAYINLTGQQNFSEFNFTSPTLQLTINGSNIAFNSSANFTLSNIKYNTTIDEWNFTISATEGILNSTIPVTQSNKNYLFYINNVYNTTYTSSNSNIILNWSNWSVDLINFSLLLDPAYNNSIPTFTTLILIPSTKKNNQTININASGITDDSTSWQLQTYYKNGSTPVYISNSSWGSESSINITATIPFTTGGAHIIYAVVYDSGNVTGQSNLTSSELQATFTSLTTDPTIESSSLSASSITVGGTVTITAQFNGQGANISSATVNVERPDATNANWTMTCDSGEIVNCTRSYTSTSDIGTYYIRYFYPTDTAGITAQISSVLTFTASAVVASSSSGGGGYSPSVVYITPTATSGINLSIIGITEGARSVSEVEKINKCLTDSFFLSNECRNSAVIAIKEQTNWYTLSGIYISSLFTLVILGTIIKKKRSFIIDPLIYTVLTAITVLGATLVGFNSIFLFNYLFNNSLSAYTFFSFVMYGFIGTVLLDELVFKKPVIYTVRKINI